MLLVIGSQVSPLLVPEPAYVHTSQPPSLNTSTPTVIFSYKNKSFTMASQPPEYVRPQLGPNRCPRLSYRTKSGHLESVNTMSTSTSNPASPQQSDFCPSPRFPPSLISDTSSSSSSMDPTMSTTSLPPRPQANVSKKRSGFLSGLFGAKEPSAQALAEYQKQLMKQGNGRVTAVGLPGVSSAKLPPTVPKTNSKWDGVPQVVKEKEKHQEKAKRYSSGGSYQTNSSADSMRSDTRTNRTPPSRKYESRGGGSVHSNGSSNNLADLYGWEVRGLANGDSIKEKDFAAEGSRPSTSGNTLSFAAPTLQRDSKFPPRDPPKIVRTDFENPQPTMLGALTPEHSSSPTLTPCDPSPLTPDAHSNDGSQSSPHNNDNTDDYFNTTILEVPSFGTEVIVKSAGHNVLGPPATAKRRPKPSTVQSDTGISKIQGSDFQVSPILKKDTIASKNTPSPRPATASGSDSPAKSGFTRKGLGLAVTLKNQGSAPSLTPRPIRDESAKEERAVTPTPEGSHSLRRKSRMSLFAH